MASSVFAVFKKISLLQYTIVCAIIGLALGLILAGTNAKKYPILLQWVGLIGTLFLRALTALVVPLVMTSVIHGVSTMFDMGANFKKIGGLTIAYYLFTTFLSVIEAAAVGNLLGLAYKENKTNVVAEPSSVYWDEGAYITLNFPFYTENNGYFDEITAAKIQFKFPNDELKEITSDDLAFHYANKIMFSLPIQHPKSFGALKDFVILNVAGAETLPKKDFEDIITIMDYQATNEVSDSLINLFYSLVPNNIVGSFTGCPAGGCGASLLSILVLAILISVFSVMIREKKKKENPDYQDLILPLNEQVMNVLLRCIGLLLACTPIAILSLVANAIGSNTFEELKDVLSSLGAMFAAAVALLVVHCLVVLAGIAFILTRKNPYTFMFGLRQAVSMSLATASSASAYPFNLQACINHGLPAPIVRFVLSLGLTINMNGSAISISMIVLWLARQIGEPLTFSQNIMLGITSALMSAGASPIPGLTPFCILTWSAVKGGTVPAQISYILAIDWLIDRVLTTVNILGDSIGAFVIANHFADEVIADDLNNDSHLPSDLEHDAGLGLKH